MSFRCSSPDLKSAKGNRPPILVPAGTLGNFDSLDLYISCRNRQTHVQGAAAGSGPVGRFKALES